MQDVSFNNKIKEYAKINKISEDEAKKKLEQEEELEEKEEEIVPGSVGQKLDEESMEVLEQAGMLSLVQSSSSLETHKFNGITFTVDKSRIASSVNFKFDEQNKKLTISGSKCTINITEANPDIDVVLSGIDMTLNSIATVKSIKNSGIRSVINGSEGDDDITSTGIDAIINAGKGNDKVKSSGIRTTIRGGAGDDDIDAKGIGTNVIAGKGNDTVKTHGIDIFVDGGAGSDSLNANGVNIAIDGGTSETDDNSKNTINARGVNVTAFGSKNSNEISEINVSGSNVTVDEETKTEHDAIKVNNRVVQEATPKSASTSTTASTQTTESSGSSGSTSSTEDTSIELQTASKNAFLSANSQLDGTKLTFEYDKNNRVIAFTDENGEKTEIEYDDDGNLYNEYNIKTGLYYKNGIPLTGFLGSILYEDGEPFDGEKTVTENNQTTITSYYLGKVTEKQITHYSDEQQTEKTKEETFKYDNKSRLSYKQITNYEDGEISDTIIQSDFVYGNDYTTKPISYKEVNADGAFDVTDIKYSNGNVKSYVQTDEDGTARLWTLNESGVLALANGEIDGETYVDGVRQITSTSPTVDSSTYITDTLTKIGIALGEKQNIVDIVMDGDKVSSFKVTDEGGFNAPINIYTLSYTDDKLSNVRYTQDFNATGTDPETGEEIKFGRSFGGAVLNYIDYKFDGDGNYTGNITSMTNGTMSTAHVTITAQDKEGNVIYELPQYSGTTYTDITLESVTLNFENGNTLVMTPNMSITQDDEGNFVITTKNTDGTETIKKFQSDGTEIVDDEPDDSKYNEKQQASINSLFSAWSHEYEKKYATDFTFDENDNLISFVIDYGENSKATYSVMYEEDEQVGVMSNYGTYQTSVYQFHEDSDFVSKLESNYYDKLNDVVIVYPETYGVDGDYTKFNYYKMNGKLVDEDTYNTKRTTRYNNLTALQTLLSDNLIDVHEPNKIVDMDNVVYDEETDEVLSFTLANEPYTVTRDTETNNITKIASDYANTDGVGQTINFTTTDGTTWISSKELVTKITPKNHEALLEKVSTTYSSKDVESSRTIEYLVNGVWTTDYPYTIELPTIEFPTIPEEKGSYENGTLILYDTKINDDGTTSKIWDYAYEDSDNTRTITQNYDANGNLINTVVEDYETDGTNEYLYSTTFDTQKNYSKRESYSSELLGDGYITITTATDPTGTGVDTEVEIEKIPLAKTASSTEEIEENPVNVLLQSLAELPKLEDLNFTNYNLGDLIAATADNNIYGMNPFQDILRIINNFSNFPNLYTMLRCAHAEINENGLVTNIDGFDIQIQYDSNNRISEIVETCIGDTCTQKYIRDENGNVNQIEMSLDYKDTGVLKTIITLDENSNIKEIQYTGNSIYGTTNLILDNDFNITSFTKVTGSDVYTYDSDNKILTKTSGDITSGTYHMEKYSFSGCIYSNNENYDWESKKLYEEDYENGHLTYKIEYGTDGVYGDWRKMERTYDDMYKFTSFPETSDSKYWLFYEDGSPARYTKDITGALGIILGKDSVMIDNGYNFIWVDGELYSQAYTFTYSDGDSFVYSGTPEEIKNFVSLRNADEKATVEHYARFGVIYTPNYIEYVATEVPTPPDITISIPEVKEVTSESLNIEKHEQTPLPEEFGKKPVESMTTEEMATEIGQYYDWLIANAYNNSEKASLTAVKSGYVAQACEELIRDIRTKVAILDSSSTTDGKSSAVESDSKVGTYTSTPQAASDTNSAEEDTSLIISNILQSLNSLQSKNANFYNNNITAITNVLNSSNISKSLLNTINSKVDKNKQQGTGDCWLLSAINTFIDDGEGGLNGIVEKVGDGEMGGCNVTFKSCTINVEDINGQIHTINVSGKTIFVSTKKLNWDAGYLNGKKYQLSKGDQDVKAIEIAWYILCADNGITPAQGQKDEVSMKLLYGENITTAGNVAITDVKNKRCALTRYWDCDPDTWDHPEQIFEFVDLNTIGSNCIAGTGFDNWSDYDYTTYIEMKRKMLINAGYNKAEVESAFEQIQTRYNINSNDGKTVHIPDKDGRLVRIYGNHAYTVAGVSNGYVKLINPHDNSVSFEISEIYFKLLFNDMTWAN